MHRIFVFIIISFLFAITACEDALTKEVEVWHDCTGSFLVHADGDLKVCNKEFIEEFSSGELIDVTYTIIKEDDCPSLNNFLCNLWHPYGEVIEIQKINN